MGVLTSDIEMQSLRLPIWFLVLLWSNISSLCSLLELNIYSMPLYVAITRLDFSVDFKGDYS